MNTPDYKFNEYLITKFFKNTYNGFFIECGANDGIAGSPCKPFEAMGWLGINVEANPHCYELLKKNRPNCVNYCCALGAKEGKMPFYIPEGASRKKMAGGSTLHKEIHAGRTLEEKQVDVKTYYNIIKDNIDAFDKIDLFLLDVEGHELEVIEGMKGSKHLPRVFVIEYSKVDMELLNEKLINDMGYKIKGIYKDNICYEKNI